MDPLLLAIDKAEVLMVENIQLLIDGKSSIMDLIELAQNDLLQTNVGDAPNQTTQENKKILEGALLKGQVKLSESLTIAQLDNLSQSIQDAHQAFIDAKIVVDKAAVQEFISTLDAYSEEQYGSYDWGVIQSLYVEASILLKDTTIGINVLAQRMEQMHATIDGLVKLNRTALDRAIIQAGKVSSDYYTEPSFMTLQDTINHAQTVYLATSVEQVQLDEQVINLKTAEADLVLKPIHKNETEIDAPQTLESQQSLVVKILGKMANDLAAVYVDGKKVEQGVDYVVHKDNLTITFTPEFIDRYNDSILVHVITSDIVYEAAILTNVDEKTEVEPNTPPTNDTSQSMMYLITLMIATVGIWMLRVLKKNKIYNGIKKV